ncbi:LydA-like holin [uncultured Caudovirales phage]|uniref:LydA-like holin n=1 Tax=uncultured Caudovirales phage TaxID=2100421 RepID=A0A6J5RUZ8_9CAUD|nr:holin [uncultured Caudovirales phage]CAB4202313.1 LydA-like holin [uncultured Caudovirales phage]
MPEKFLDYSFITIFWVSGLAIMGGIANYAKKVNDKIIKRFSLFELIGEVFISGFVGIITFLLCESAHIDLKLTAALVGISGHMGSRAIFLIEQVVNKKFKAVIKELDPDE